MPLDDRATKVDAQTTDDAAAFLAAIVESSDDAIVSKSLCGVITTWNQSAERIFGYRAEEAVGKPITIVIPSDRLEEEPAILARIQAGERVDHFETVRRRKDGALIDISLTISPIRNNRGEIIGASKVARDISERRRIAEHRELLLREMHHRVKNLFAVTGSLITLAARSAATPGELAADMKDRLMALSRAHEMTLPSLVQSAEDQDTTLFQLLSRILEPYSRQGIRLWRIAGEDVGIRREKITDLALMLHEFSTNATKYGALSVEGGTIDITTALSPDAIELVWLETNGPLASDPAETPFSGFGQVLEDRISHGLNAQIERTWTQGGLAIRLSIPRDAIT
ncbi:PAS domain S-box protein [Ensifer sp.]|uniref:PAS domain S-box protein n=1 Tax=Ensifer sp. TaxID=1872086 RepID=UPI00289A473C|nr:PAS domain S-box protein [Ensifer sp.]